MMRKFVIALSLVLFLSACGWTKEKLGMTRKTPDDGYQARKQMLVVPPDYDVRPVQKQ